MVKLLICTVLGWANTTYIARYWASLYSILLHKEFLFKIYTI